MDDDDRKERGTSGLGYLFKRGRTGERLPASSRAPGVFYLRARWADGRVADRRLVDEDGRSIRELRAAKAAQRRVRAPFLTGSRLAELEAQVAEAQRLRRREAEELDLAEPPLAVRDAWREYVRAPNRRQCGEGTLANYRRHWGAFERWLGRELPSARYLRDVDEAAAERYASHLTGLGLTANTFNKHVTFLRSMFALLRKPARMESNPFGGILRRRQVPQSRRALTVDELRRVVGAAEGELRTLLEIGFYTGLRLGDCCTLEWREVDLAAGVIRRVPRKTARTSGAVVEIGVAPPLARALAALPRSGRYVLPETAARYLGHPQGVGKAVTAHLRRCGLEVHEAAGAGRVQPVVRVSFHSLRHTWVSLQAEGGTPAALIQKAAGHSNPAMTEHYTHVGRAGLRQMAAAVDVDLTGEAPAGDARREALLERLAAAAGTAGPEALERALAALEGT